VNAGGRRVAVVGIGLNLLPLPAQPQAGSESGYSQGHASLSELVPELMPEPVPKLSAPEVLARVAEPLLQALLRFEREGFAPLAMAYARRDVLRGLPVNTTLADLPDGVAQGVDDQGALLLQRHGVPHRVVSGEVSVRLQREAVL
jgi:BirA family biotin operon repressor/biotin-[acetyl-CoA-carboxylase] ligase